MAKSIVTCDECSLSFKTLRGAMIDGKYGQFCNPCLEAQKRPSHAGSAAYSRAKDRDEHEADLVQPWTAKGNINPEFVRMYPEESADMFTKEDLNGIL